MNASTKARNPCSTLDLLKKKRHFGKSSTGKKSFYLTLRTQLDYNIATCIYFGIKIFKKKLSSYSSAFPNSIVR